MDISSINSDLIRGNVTTIILGSLWSADRYGYDILKEIESKSDGQYKLKQPTLYNQLKRLEKQGLISSYDGEAGDTGGGKRRYFTLTAEGRNFLQKEKHEYEYSRTILDKLVSANDFDFSTPAPFDTADLRPYAKKDESEVKPKIVYKDKVVEVEKLVEVEKIVEKVVEKPVYVDKTVYVDKPIYFDSYGNEITTEDASKIAENAKIEAEKAKKDAIERENAQTAPSQTLDEIFAKLEAKSEYERSNNNQSSFGASKVANNQNHNDFNANGFTNNQSHTEFGANGFTNNQSHGDFGANGFTNNQSHNEFGANGFTNNASDPKIHINPFSSNIVDEPQSAVSIKEVFAHLDERGAEIDNEIAKKSQQEAEMQQTVAENSEKMTYHTAVQHATNANDSELREAELEHAYAVEQEKQAQGFATQQAQGYATQQSQGFATQQAQGFSAQQSQGYGTQQSQGYGAQQSQEYNKQQALQTKEYTDAEIISKNPKQAAAKTASETQYAVSAVLGRRDNAFEFEKENVNYRDFFSSITSAPTKKSEPAVEKRQVSEESELKTRLYTEGFKIRPYSRGNSSEYYTFNFLQSNRINRDCALIVLALYVLEIAIMWVSLASKISYAYFLPFLFVGSALLLLPTAIYFLNRTKRKRANFNFKLSLLNRSMIFIELTVVCVLIGFFALGASVNNITLILMSIVLPMVMLTNFPVSSVIYQLLYKSKRYHIA